MRTLVYQDRVGDAGAAIARLVEAAESIGWLGFCAPTSWRLSPEDLQRIRTGAAYGSLLFAEVIASQLNWTLRFNDFDWLSTLPPEFLGRSVDFMPLGKARELGETKFIKPADDKCFAARVYQPGELEFHELVELQTPTLVSDVVAFTSEYRCFVMNGTVRTWSRYASFGELVQRDEYGQEDPVLGTPVAFVESLLKRVVAQPSVIDVGVVDGRWAVVESNPAWASGLYGCEPTAALQVIAAAVG